MSTSRNLVNIKARFGIFVYLLIRENHGSGKNIGTFFAVDPFGEGLQHGGRGSEEEGRE